MSHLLCLLFEYHRYKNDAIMRVYADDLLVDEIQLTEDIPIKSKKFRSRPPFTDMPGTGIQSKNVFLTKVPEKLFVFEIDQNNLKKSIRIEVLNDNNNYSNGFMSEFSYINFDCLLLLPRCLLHEDNWKKLTRFVNKSWFTIDSKSKPLHYNFNFFPFRGPRHEDVIVKSTSNPFTDQLIWHKRGGSFDIEIPVYWKHGQVHITKPKPGRMDLHPQALKILSLFGMLNTSK
jgi:hypothetical protein